jgi:DNA repair exonuclease SbcCD ATPase subunit
MNLDTVNKRLKILSDLQEEINKIKALYEESLENDATYQEAEKAEEEVKKVKEEVKEKKAKVKETPTMKAMEDDLKGLRNDVKEHKEMLAQELADYYKESGSLEITDEDGNTKRIKFSAKLVQP